MKEWMITDISGEQLDTDTGYSDIVKKLLASRGITGSEAIRKFMNPAYEDLHDPFLLKDMDIAVDRIILSIAQQEKILIYGDYDVDGTTSSSLLYRFFKKLGVCAEVFIPSRFEEGYGLSMAAVDKIKNSGYKLIITVDCGIASISEVDEINKLGIDIIITDHHQCQQELPRALAVVNPHRSDCSYPFKDLCGAGVAFKLVAALSQKLQLQGCEYEYMDLVALGTVADIVPLLGENRTFVHHGLKRMNNLPCYGINSLIEVAGLKGKEITSYSLAFGLAPRINAAGRLGDAMRAVRLLTSESDAEAKEYAVELNSENLLRQQTEGEILKEVIDYIEKEHDFSKSKVIVASGTNWHHGVIGIVASKVVEKYYRPCILLCNENGELRGSGRSIEGFNIFSALTACSSLLEKYGGHEMAAGLTISLEKLEEFKNQINKFADDELISGDLIEKLHVDAALNSADIKIEVARELKKLEPFGQGNPSPLFVCRDIKICNMKKFGDGRHLKFSLSSGDKLIDAVAFNMADICESYSPGDIIDIVCSLDINSYNNIDRAQLIVRDIRLCQRDLLLRKFYSTIDNTISYNSLNSETAYSRISNLQQIGEEYIGETVKNLLHENKKCVFLVNDLTSLNETVDLINQLDIKPSYRVDIGEFIADRKKNLYVLVNPRIDTVKVLEKYNIIIYGKWLDQIYIEAIVNSIDNERLFLYNNKLGVSITDGLGFNKDDIAAVYKYIWGLPGKTTVLKDIMKSIADINALYQRYLQYFSFRKCIEVLNEVELVKADFESINCVTIEKFDNRGKKVQLENSPVFRKIQGMLN